MQRSTRPSPSVSWLQEALSKKVNWPAHQVKGQAETNGCQGEHAGARCLHMLEQHLHHVVQEQRWPLSATRSVIIWLSSEKEKGKAKNLQYHFQITICQKSHNTAFSAAAGVSSLLLPLFSAFFFISCLSNVFTCLLTSICPWPTHGRQVADLECIMLECDCCSFVAAFVCSFAPFFSSLPYLHISWEERNCCTDLPPHEWLCGTVSNGSRSTAIGHQG